jgi:thiosulfate/3-mercaptopyruvate sulfurtransferase
VLGEPFSVRARFRPFLPYLLALLVIPIVIALPGHGTSRKTTMTADPWTASQALTPEALAAELAQKKGHPPIVVNVGVRILYDGAHIPGALYHGPGSSEQGLADLRSFAEKLPRTAELVIYCGCCPLEKCPNIRPAFQALHSMGFTNLRVLVLPTSFAADWVEKGYPIQKGA